MKKFRKENEVDDLDLDNLEVKEVVEEKKDTKTKIPKILLNIILIIAIIKFGANVFERYYFNEFYYKAPNLQGLNIDEAKKIISHSALILGKWEKSIQTYLMELLLYKSQQKELL